MKYVLFSIMILLFAAFNGCSDDVSTSPDERDVRPLTELEKSLVDSDNHFGLKMFRAMSASGADENLFISPLSISLALGMTLNGADAGTKDAMRNTLEFNGLDQDDINESYRSLLELLGSMDPKVIFDIANSIWYRQGYSVEQDFLSVNRDYFDAQVQALDFASASAPDIINRWVNDSTNGKIQKMLNEIPVDAVMYLINAIYFKGIWSNEFEKKMTRDDQFITLSGERIPCRMMHLKEYFKYFETDQFQAIDMPYGYGDFSMTILLPQDGVNINDFISNISNDDWNMWMSRFSSREGTIEMPKFTMEYEASLNDVLKSLGMAIAFTPGQANFSKINKENNLFISNVKHKSYVKVDEEGTEAAAATSVEISLTSVRSTNFYMRVDRPFLFAIRENRSQTILFIGKMMQPESD